MERSLPSISRYFDRFPTERKSWSERLGIDLDDQAMLPGLIIRDALNKNEKGPVLFSSTRPDRIRGAAAEANQDRTDPEGKEELASAFQELAAAVVSANLAPGTRDH